MHGFISDYLGSDVVRSLQRNNKSFHNSSKVRTNVMEYDQTDEEFFAASKACWDCANSPETK